MPTLVQAGEAVRNAINELRTEQPVGQAEERIELALDNLSRTEREDALFGDSALGLRESWVGVRFGCLAGCESFRLADKAQEGFDLTLGRAGEVHAFDVTEALDPMRERVSEYRRADGPDHEGHDEVVHQRGLFARVVGNRLKRKQGPDKRVLVYVNTGWLPGDAEIEASIARWHRNFHDKFRSADILLRDGRVRIAPDLREINPCRRRSGIRSAGFAAIPAPRESTG
jgi:hypothetical protein